jgi:hypothetical protein
MQMRDGSQPARAWRLAFFSDSTITELSSFVASSTIRRLGARFFSGAALQWRRSGRG